MALEPPFADADDLKARWPGFPTGSEDYAEVLLGDASVMLMAEFPGIEQDEAKAEALKIVACNIVRRAMANDAGAGGDDIPYGAKTVQEGAGAFQSMATFESPVGAMFIWPSDRKLLGSGQQRAFEINLMPNPDEMRR